MIFGPVALSYQIVIWFIVVACFVFGDRTARHFGAALALSSIAAFAEAWTGYRGYIALGLVFASVAAVTGGTRAALAMTFLYGLRLVNFSVESVGLVSFAVQWEINMVFLTLQMLLAGGAITGGLAAHSESSNFVANMFRKYDQIANRAIFN